jgi:hypothetical protein
MLTAVVTLVGLGVLWGALKAQVAQLREELDRLLEITDRQEMHLHRLQEEVRVNFAAQAASKKRTHRRANGKR